MRCQFFVKVLPAAGTRVTFTDVPGRETCVGSRSFFISPPGVLTRHPGRGRRHWRDRRNVRVLAEGEADRPSPVVCGDCPQGKVYTSARHVVHLAFRACLKLLSKPHINVAVSSGHDSSYIRPMLGDRTNLRSNYIKRDSEVTESSPSRSRLAKVQYGIVIVELVNQTVSLQGNQCLNDKARCHKRADCWAGIKSSMWGETSSMLPCKNRNVLNRTFSRKTEKHRDEAKKIRRS